MPVYKPWIHHPREDCQVDDVTGTYQVFFDRREREYTNIKRKARHGDLARHLVPGISQYEAEEEGPSYDSRGEDVRALRIEIRSRTIELEL